MLTEVQSTCNKTLHIDPHISVKKEPSGNIQTHSAGFLMGINHKDVAVISPQDPVLRIGSSVTAMCTLSPELGLHASTLYWTLNGMRLSSSTYSLVSSDILSITLHGLNGSQQQSGDNLVCHGADGHVLGGSCLYVGISAQVVSWEERRRKITAWEQRYSCYIPRNLPFILTTDPLPTQQVSRAGDPGDQLTVRWASLLACWDILFQAKYQIRHRLE
ncbi:cytokine receptor-like factor 1 isoform X1 [Lates japonicus]|uniref:Cytokine receptor-like factor 1 isoform X1 n=1 Tax=Lates japonicus TaxID=270547 RepID=A0AAD3NF90_LATJO|nr:cytokine receptor-like factor 1 isoform X1 [Lates japonicus]